MSADVEARLARLEARAELRDLTIRYCAACDDRDVDLVVSLFAPDGTFRHDDGKVHATGRDAIRAYYTKTLENMGPSIHIPYTQLVDFDADDRDVASGIVQSRAEMALGGQAVWAAMRYHDDYRRVDGQWRFARRVLRFWYLMPLSELPTGMAAELRRTWPGEPVAVQLPETLPTWQRFYGVTASA